VKNFCNAKNDIPYIQDIEIIIAFYDGVNDIKTVEEITMKKPRMVDDLLKSLTCALRLPKLGLDFLSPATRGPRRRNRMIGRSTQLTEEITKIVETMDIMEIACSSPWIRKKRGRSIALMRQKSSARSIVPQDMIWQSAKLFWIVTRCHHHQHWWPKNPVGENTAGLIPPTMMSRWERST
jgi:hypothetical protein